MKRIALFLSVFLLTSVLLGCSGGGTKTSETPPTELMISAAASLTDALEELKNTYEDTHEGVTLTFNFGGSGKLAAQIEQGAPADVFLSASKKDMDVMEEKGLIDVDSRIDFTSNRLVLIAPEDAATDISSFEMIDSHVIQHLVIGETETVPVGRYTKEVLEHLGLWEPLQEKLVLGSDVRQVLTHVELGNADLGIVYSSDAHISNKVNILAESDDSWHSPIVYPGAVVQESKHQEAAQAFLNYLVSDEGKEVLQKYGFQ